MISLFMLGNSKGVVQFRVSRLLFNGEVQRYGSAYPENYWIILGEYSMGALSRV